MFTRNWTLAVACTLLVVVSALGSSAQGAPVTLGSLLDNGSIQVGDKIFYDFHDFSSVASGGATAVSPSDIYVSAKIDDAEVGLLFQSAALYAGQGDTQDTHFDFRVKVAPESLQQGWTISDNTLEMTAGRDVDGRVTIHENVSTADETISLANKIVNLDAENTKLRDHQVFSQTATDIHIEKDVALFGGAAQGSFASVSDFSQTFSQVPEPCSMIVLSVLGGLGLLRRRSK